MKRLERIQTTQWRNNSGVNNIVPTHIMLLYTDRILSPSIFEQKLCPFYRQQHIQITRRHNFGSHPDVGLMLILSQRPCVLLGLARDLSRLFIFTVHSTKFSFTLKTE